MLQLLPIKETIAENTEFAANPACQETLEPSIAYYKKIGYHPPWIGYYIEQDGHIVGSAAFKGQPLDGKVEIAYVVFDAFRQQGIATKACKILVEMAQKTDASIRITAQTLPDNNYSTRILQKNNFKLLGSFMHEEDGEVWEWEHQTN